MGRVSGVNCRRVRKSCGEKGRGGDAACQRGNMALALDQKGNKHVLDFVLESSESQGRPTKNSDQMPLCRPSAGLFDLRNPL